jgi:hypothetical protein
MWELVDLNGELIQEVNCEYDAIDIARGLYNARVIELDFDNQVATIKEYED